MRTLLICLLLLLPVSAQARNIVEEANRIPVSDHDFDSETAPWKELLARLPAYPKPDTLVSFITGSSARSLYFVDMDSVSVGSDGVVRYSLLIRSPSGAETVSYEGLRCDKGEHKLYAFGRPDGEWAKNNRASWSPIRARAQNNPQSTLFFHYFCTVDAQRDAAKLQRILRTGGIYNHE